MARLGAQTVKELHEDLYTMKTRPGLTASALLLQAAWAWVQSDTHGSSWIPHGHFHGEIGKPWEISGGFQSFFPNIFKYLQINPDGLIFAEASRSDLRPPLLQPEEVFSHELCDLRAETMEIGQTLRWLVLNKWPSDNRNN